MKLEKIAQILDIVSNSNNNNVNTKNFNGTPTSDVLSYNLVAGKLLLNRFHLNIAICFDICFYFLIVLRF